MSHGITDEDRAAFAHQPAWHGLGEVFPHFISRDKAKEVLGWEPNMVRIGKLDDEFGMEFEDHLGVVRSDTQAPLGIVGKNWTPITNSDSVDFISDVIAKTTLGGDRIESVASLFGGKRVFIVANLGDWDIVRAATKKPDLYKSYLATMMAHDGTMAWHGFFTDIRVVCYNTMQLSLSEAEGDHNANMFRIKHTLRAGERMKLAETMAAEHINYQQALKEEMEHLETQRMHLTATRDWAANVLAGFDEAYGTANQVIEAVRETWKPKDNKERETPMDRIQQGSSEIAQLFSQGAGNLGHTKYDALNGLTEWLDHQRVRYKRAKDVVKYRENCLVDTFMGESVRTKTRALNMLKRW